MHHKQEPFRKQLHDLFSSPRFLLIVLGAVLIITLLFFISQVTNYSRRGYLSFTNHPTGIFRHHHSPLGLVQVSDIQPWMTFNFINHVFKLPENYLKTTLTIHNTKYPNLTIDSFAKENSTPTITELNTIKNSITNYGKQTHPAQQ